MKKQNKEIKTNMKKLEKLEEKFVKVNTDFKNVLNDKTNIEAFLKNVFPKDMHDKLIKEDYGTYDTSELSKLWLVLDSQNQSEYQNVLSKLKTEINDLNEHNQTLQAKYNQINEMYEQYKTEQNNNNDSLNHYMNGYEELKVQNESLLQEKDYLMKLLDDKNAEIEQLNKLELENAELKAQSLLLDLDTNNNNNNNNSNVHSSDKNVYTYTSSSLLKSDNVSNINTTAQIKITSLNIGVQTEERVYYDNDIQEIKNELEMYKNKYEKTKKDFLEYKDKSHRILLENETNYNKILNEHQTLKKELSQLLTKHNQSKRNDNNNIIRDDKLKAPSVVIGKDIVKFDIKEKISNEYLKNVLLKYLEAIAIGNEFQTKILENVIFTVLNVSGNEKKKLEEKRYTSSFYYNLWFNAKAFLSARIYGEEQQEEDKINNDVNENSSNDNNSNSNNNSEINNNIDRDNS
jgi:hypothetical protein